MENTIIYLIRHADTIKEDGIRNTNEDTQNINEKEILSVEGEKKSRKLAEYKPLRNIDVIWSSSYTRAKETAKYIAYNNNLPINIDSNLNERKLGNLDELSIKFLLLNWCKVNDNTQLIYKNKILDIESPCLIKLIFKEKQLISLEQLNLGSVVK
ncbi:MAG: histidine phosphatase family protein [Clostridia bacterium]|nr:histidine phosphatase family protein [Clostridia bacterium]